EPPTGTRRGAACRCGSVLLCFQSADSWAGGCSCGSLATSTTVVVRQTCGCLLNLRSGTTFGFHLDSTGPPSRRAVPAQRRGTGGTREPRRCVGATDKVGEHARRRLRA